MTAMDARTGDMLWKFQTGWGISAPPMTYSVNGVQYVAVAAGGNRGGNTTLDGDAVWAFALNGTVDEVPAPPPIQTKTSIGGAPVHLGEPIGRVVTIGQDVPFDGTVNMEDYFFVPTRPAVPVGTTLNFKNNGSVTHTATDNQLQWDTGNVAPGETAPITFNSAGTFTFTCTPHPWMIGQVIVQ
jgi:quinohemoprotein ethanol dehydrogenase